MSERTNRKYNLQIFDPHMTIGDYDMPTIQATTPPEGEMLPFNYAKTHVSSDKIVHFFIDDYQFNRLWERPEQYLSLLSKFEATLTPDFSLYVDMPAALKIYNIYRSRLLGQFWQQNGIKVIPTVSWAEEESFEYCFDGLPHEATIAVSTVGIGRNADARKTYQMGLDEMIKRLSPQHLIVYGPSIGAKYPPGLDIISHENEITERMHSLRRRK